MNSPLDKLDVDILKALILLAENESDGHLTIMKFTTNWRISFTTPHTREDIQEMPKGATFRQAAMACIDTQVVLT
jgi:hypothetical protein